MFCQSHDFLKFIECCIDQKCFQVFLSVLQHDLESHGDRIPAAIRCSVERLRDNGVYLLGMAYMSISICTVEENQNIFVTECLPTQYHMACYTDLLQLQRMVFPCSLVCNFEC